MFAELIKLISYLKRSTSLRLLANFYNSTSHYMLIVKYGLNSSLPSVFQLHFVFNSNDILEFKVNVQRGHFQILVDDVPCVK